MLRNKSEALEAFKVFKAEAEKQCGKQIKIVKTHRGEKGIREPVNGDEAYCWAKKKQAWEAASQAVKDEEAIKQKLCEDLNSLVLESSNSQLARLEELKRRLEALNPSRASTASASDQSPVGPVQSSMTQDVSSVNDTQESVSGSSGNTLKEGNARSSAAENGQKQLPSLDEARSKKKINLQGRGKGIGIVPTGRGSAAPGWTGAGFDVDGRS
ncbi:uncharacterized protein LOC132643798 [Lycium barbarum]|uniref:uncharacterized protein LOC132643798 n=1 Tax=Lycium barbarum TaxID=112863 RepID=UPI00293E09BA|nr:uncharacterized protein LOC132643798 [Lycium barbarum]